jgi:ferredoxin-NADP reductase
MEGTAVRGRLTWQTGTALTVADETPTTRTIAFELPHWAGHQAGQHLDVRLTAPDGYSAERSYSIASAPGEPVAITVQRLDDGEVSPYLTDELRAGDQLEVRGPIGGYFVWDGGSSPVLLVAGGSGVVPLRAILRHHQLIGSTAPVRLLYSVRSLADVIYRSELDGYPGLVSYTRRAGPATPAASLRGCSPTSPGRSLLGRPASSRSRSSAGRRRSWRQSPRRWSPSATRRAG